MGWSWFVLKVGILLFMGNWAGFLFLGLEKF